ncbi:MAG TPA: DUF6702 family protein [Chitinophagaceae bacterium]
MAIEFYKWLLVPFSCILLFANGKKENLFTEKAIHPLHLATVEIDHNAADKTLEITCKTFWDDFESILSKINKAKVDLVSGKDTAGNNKKIFEYIKSHLQITADAKPAQLSFVGYEKEDVVVYSYLQVDNISSVKNVNIVNTIMHDMFDDQVNIIHVIVKGERKSTKLDYPATAAKMEF